MFTLYNLLTTLIALTVLKKVLEFLASRSRRSKLFAKLVVFQANRMQYIESTLKYKSSLPQDLKEKLLKSDAITLLSLLNKREITSKELVLVFYERAIDIGLKLNALAEVNIESALEQAKECDLTREEIFKQDPSKLSGLPPLFGLPISIKSNIKIKGLSSNVGCLAFMDHRPPEDGLILKLLKKQGAIPFITSNVPQSLMINETVNRIYGRCQNAWSSERTSGGSSGGEATLIATGCSPLGIGNDIGGSIRIPCLYSGLYGIKVSTNRLTYEGEFSGNKSSKIGQINVKACHGPMGKTVEDIALVLKSLFNKDMWDEDTETVPLPWNEEEYRSERKLRIGYVEEDRFFAVSPGNKRAVLEAVEGLKSAGHEVVKVDFPNFERATIQYLAIMSSAGKFRPFREMMGDEPPVDEYTQMIRIMRIPKILRGVISKIMKLIKENRAARILPKTHEKTAWEYLQASEVQQVIKQEVLNWWKLNKLDALVSPGLASPAIKHGESADAFLSCCYTFYFNLIDYPTGAVPITKVRKEEQVYIDPINRDKYARLMGKSLKGTEGLPLGVQVTTLPLKEELCLNVMRQIEKKVDFHELPIKI